jgi:hypothetical protein
LRCGTYKGVGEEDNPLALEVLERNLGEGIVGVEDLEREVGGRGVDQRHSKRAGVGSKGDADMT